MSSTAPIAVAAVVSVLLAVWVFGGEPDYEVVFPVVYMLDLDTKLPLDSVEEVNRLPTKNAWVFSDNRFNLNTSHIPELKQKRPDLFAKTTKDDFCVNIYHQLLQRSIFDFLSELYHGSWKAEALRFNIPQGDIRLMGPAGGPKPTHQRY